MKTTNSRKVIIALGWILAATLATGCFGVGDGYSSSYSSYGESHAYTADDRGHSYPQSNVTLYSADNRGARRIVF
jgi:hypothetical protein